MERAKKSRMVLVNQDLWYFASAQAMSTTRKRWSRLLRDSAQWQASAFLSGPAEPEFLDSFRTLLSEFFWDCSDARIEQSEDGGDLEVTIAFVPEMPLEHTQGLFEAFERMFNVRGYLATDAVVNPGFLSLTLKGIGGNTVPAKR